MKKKKPKTIMKSQNKAMILIKKKKTIKVIRMN